MTKVLILGAGSTIGTLGRKNLGAVGFIERLGEVFPDWKREYGDIVAAHQNCRSPNLDKIWRHVDYAGKLVRSLQDTPAYPDVSGQLRRALLLAYGLEKEMQDVDLRSDFDLGTEIACLKEGDALVSFNWDTVAETIAKERGIPLVAAGPVIYEHAVNLLKPHGSLSWLDRGTGHSVVWREPSTGRPLLKPMTMGRDSYPQPLVLGAVPIKDELIKETQPNHDLYALIADQWAGVVNAVARASEIVVLGYGFPPEDDYGRFLFSEAARRQLRDPEFSFYAGDEDKAREQVKSAIEEIFRCELSEGAFKGSCSAAKARKEAR